MDSSSIAACDFGQVVFAEIVLIQGKIDQGVLIIQNKYTSPKVNCFYNSRYLWDLEL